MTALASQKHKSGMFVKRVIDVSVSGTLLAIVSPAYFLIAQRVRKEMGEPVLFRQARPGLHGKPYEVRKFRTMIVETVDASGRILGDAERTPPLGYFLRRTSLDEIPQLISVFKGDMSLVGPRPLLMSYLSKYTPEQSRRHDVRPGITGLAQVSGRQNLLFSERFRLDVWYVDNWSLFLDMKILARTVKNVLSSKDIITGQDVSDVDDLGFNLSHRFGEESSV